MIKQCFAISSCRHVTNYDTYKKVQVGKDQEKAQSARVNTFSQKHNIDKLKLYDKGYDI